MDNTQSIEKGKKLLTYVGIALIVLPIIQLISITALASSMDIEINISSTIFELIIRVIFVFFILQGYRWPLHIITGAFIISLATVVESLSILGEISPTTTFVFSMALIATIVVIIYCYVSTPINDYINNKKLTRAQEKVNTYSNTTSTNDKNSEE